MAYALAKRIERAVKKAGVKYRTVSGWRNRGRGTMGSIQSIMCHHTAGPASGNSPSLNVVTNGRPGLSGPLSQLFLARDGTVIIVAAGRSNHAGRVSSNRYTNSHSIGIEAEATGTSSWPDHQIEAYAKLCKALIDEFGLSTSRVVGHKEAGVPRGRKIDPNFSMDDFRAKVGGAKGGVSQDGGSTGGSAQRYGDPKAKHEPGSRTLKLYSAGTDVTWLQKELQKLDRYTGGKVDGYYGPAMVSAVTRYQRSRDLSMVDGMAGKQTFDAIKSGAKKVQDDLAGQKQAPSKPSGSTAPKFPFPRGHWMGVESSNPKNHSGYHAKDRPGIKRWQSQMLKRGWAGIGKADGRFGPKSQRVARQFQAEKNLAVDGLVGESTWSASWSAPVT